MLFNLPILYSLPYQIINKISSLKIMLKDLLIIIVKINTINGIKMYLISPLLVKFYK